MNNFKYKITLEFIKEGEEFTTNWLVNQLSRIFDVDVYMEGGYGNHLIKINKVKD